MTDLFGRLAQRALASGLAVRPITPPVFGAPASPPTELADRGAARAPGQGGAVASGGRPASAKDLPPADPRGEPRFGGERLPARGVVPRPQRRRSAPTEAEAREAAGPGEDTRGAAAAARRPQVVEGRATVGSTVRPAAALAAEPAMDRAAVGRSLPAARESRASELDRGVVPASRDRADPAPRPRTPPGETASTRPRRQQPAQQPPAPPAIRVTIGRVEVRAAAPPAAATPRPPRPPRLSLDDYLEARRGGRG
jgi:hypothetical protein